MRWVELIFKARPLNTLIKDVTSSYGSGKSLAKILKRITFIIGNFQVFLIKSWTVIFNILFLPTNVSLIWIKLTIMEYLLLPDINLFITITSFRFLRLLN